MGKHTQGPWIVEHDKEWGNITIWAGSAIEERHSGSYPSAGEMNIYTSCYGDHESDEELIANARLIVAAPDLLEAAKGLIETIGAYELEAEIDSGEEDEGAVRLMKAAIAKAEGKS